MRQISDAGVALIRAHEGCKLDAYQDQRGIWTIGWGHTIGVKPGDSISQETADGLLQDDIEQRAEGPVDALTRDRPTTQHQFDAMCSLCYNIGTGNFKESTVLKLHLAADYASAADAFMWWDKTHVDGELVEVEGLKERRQAERTLYLTPDDGVST